MRILLDRSVLTLARHEGIWRVEHEGAAFGHSPDKEIARAAANRYARQMLDTGRPCQVKVSGEGLWAF